MHARTHIYIYIDRCLMPVVTNAICLMPDALLWSPAADRPAGRPGRRWMDASSRRRHMHASTLVPCACVSCHVACVRVVVLYAAMLAVDVVAGRGHASCAVCPVNREGQPGLYVFFPACSCIYCTYRQLQETGKYAAVSINLESTGRDFVHTRIHDFVHLFT